MMLPGEAPVTNYRDLPSQAGNHHDTPGRTRGPCGEVQPGRGVVPAPGPFGTARAGLCG